MRFQTDRPSCRPSCEEVRHRIDDLLDGLDPEPALASHLEACPACARELALARRLQAAMAEGLPPLRCPDGVSEAVLALAKQEVADGTASAGRRSETTGPWPGRRKTGRYKDLGPNGNRRFAWLDDFFGGALLRPAMAAVVVLLLVAAPVAVWRSLDDGAAPTTAETAEPASELDGYTAAEVAQAEEEARQVLAYIASVSRDAGEAVRQEVFEERVVEPVRRLAETPPTGDSPSGEETP